MALSAFPVHLMVRFQFSCVTLEVHPNVSGRESALRSVETQVWAVRATALGARISRPLKYNYHHLYDGTVPFRYLVCISFAPAPVLLCSASTGWRY